MGDKETEKEKERDKSNFSSSSLWMLIVISHYNNTIESFILWCVLCREKTLTLHTLSVSNDPYLYKLPLSLLTTRHPHRQ